ncbi:MAG TPA: class I SAM-dependent methyltransferase [Thermoanaerobaculia bacterium]|nr:class I SAM-dependent methyltransferase [Thermoanaerobaculia bacterium]
MNAMNGTAAFYDDLAELYDLVYSDWTASIERQSTVLDGIIRHAAPGAKIVADVACGIGTQTLGLAARGYEMIASDVSPGAIGRARREAAARGLTIDFRCDDMTALTTYGDASADVVIACDNAIPHLLSDDEIVRAFRQFRRVVRGQGLVIISVRDYATMDRAPLQLIPCGVRIRDGRKVAVFQVWEWEGEQYQLNMYFVSDGGTGIDTKVMRSRYYAIAISRLITLFADAGFGDVRRMDGPFFQPLIVARLM